MIKVLSAAVLYLTFGVHAQANQDFWQPTNGNVGPNLRTFDPESGIRATRIE
ncbi:MAG: hypothetical protein ACR2QX_03640 [Woeseiaceae bacterium]